MPIWNFRLVKVEDGTIGVHEVYYDENGKPSSMTEKVYTLYYEEFEDYEDLKGDLELIIEHLDYDHSILEYPKDFNIEKPKPLLELVDEV